MPSRRKERASTQGQGHRNRAWVFPLAFWLYSNNNDHDGELADYSGYHELGAETGKAANRRNCRERRTPPSGRMAFLG